MGEFAQFVLTSMAAAALRQILSWTVEHIHGELSRLTDHAAQLATEAGCAVDPQEQRIGHMIGVRMPGGVPHALGEALSAERIYVSVRGDAIRIAPHLYNTTADIDRLFAVLDRVRAAGIGV
jgi:selenocysteine lyase/cysteine desulfurase